MFPSRISLRNFWLISLHMRRSCNKPNLSTFWRFYFFQTMPFFFYKCFPIRSKTTFKSSKILSKNFWKKSKNIFCRREIHSQRWADLQNQWCAPWWSDGFGGRPHLWEWISRRQKIFFDFSKVFQKYFR